MVFFGYQNLIRHTYFTGHVHWMVVSYLVKNYQDMSRTKELLEINAKRAYETDKEKRPSSSSVVV
jgi:hypothetical protein